MFVKNKEVNWEEFDLTNGYLFTAVMQNKYLCKSLIKRLLPDSEITEIEYLEIEKTMKPGYESKGVRLDVYIKDQDEVAYNLEIQIKDTKELQKRARYYQSVIDLNSLPEGYHYSILKKNYIIFICLEDVFGEGRYCYVFENICLDADNLKLDDGTYKIFLNTKGSRGKVSQEVKNFLVYLENGEVGVDPFIKELDDEMNRIKNNNEWRKSYMTQQMRDLEKIEEGEVRGAYNNALKVAKAALENSLSPELISTLTGLSLDVIQGLKMG